MKKFVTLFPHAMNFHLTKDVGMIPYMMGTENLGYDTELVTYNNDEYSYLEKESKGLQLTFLDKKTGNEMLDTLIYIWKNAKSIDVLNLYHWGRKAYFRMLLYKLRNPKGVVFVKLDMSMNGVEVLQNNKRARYIFKQIVKKAECVSVESTMIQSELKKKVGVEVQYFPNGFKYYSNNQIDKKDKIVLTVGRIGTEQKATKELVGGFVEFWKTHKDWKLVLVGPIEEDFLQWYENINSKEKLDNVINLIGEVQDKKELARYYKSASIFALPSRWESFGLVLVEAMSFGCSLLTTEKVVAAKDILNDNCVIIPTESEENIAIGLAKIVDEIGVSALTIEKNIEDVNKYFNWGVLAKKLDEMLSEFV